jgi:hypothetical protein
MQPSLSDTQSPAIAQHGIAIVRVQVHSQRVVEEVRENAGR